ncbi:uncharacterized protein LOC135438627 [Drosophila montana]|uniref:uncharacterized protein LOC135438627 n=1 Tax=Drosophila montana TaxID=40370 RepID=UPI00313B5266
MFNSLFSNRYNKKREIFYAQYEETRQRYSNLPIYKRPKEPLSCKSPKYSRRIRKPADYDYDEWIAGHFVSIVVRRAIEQWSRRQLMEPVSSLGSDACSWRSWPSGADPAEPRRSLRLADKPNLSLNEIGNPSHRETSGAIKWQQQLPSLDADNKLGSSSETFIDGWVAIFGMPNIEYPYR